MNRFYIAILLLCFIISLSFFEIFIFDKTVNSLIINLNKLKLNLSKGRREYLNNLSNFKNQWEAKQNILMLFFNNRSSLDKVSLILKKLKYKQGLFQIRLQLEKCMFLIKTIFENEKPTFENII